MASGGHSKTLARHKGERSNPRGELLCFFKEGIASFAFTPGVEIIFKRDSAASKRQQQRFGAALWRTSHGSKTKVEYRCAVKGPRDDVPTDMWNSRLVAYQRKR